MTLAGARSAAPRRKTRLNGPTTAQRSSLFLLLSIIAGGASTFSDAFVPSAPSAVERAIRWPSTVRSRVVVPSEAPAAGPPAYSIRWGALQTEAGYRCEEKAAVAPSSPPATDRRSVLSAAAVAALLTLATSPTPSLATASEVDDGYPPITQTIYLDVRISRSDGSFYVRDDLPDTPENRVYQGRLTLGLFGTVAPNHCKEFLKYADVKYDPAADDPVPSYGRSMFSSLDQSTGLLVGGSIPGLEITSIGGSTALRYGGKILPAPLWLESSSSPESERLSHDKKGLLTHRTLDVSPAFGITTRPAASELDATHVVFGRVLPNEEGAKLLRVCEDLPTYSMDRPVPTNAVPENEASRVVDEVAGKVFATQREFFRGAAKTFGDTRLEKVYEGKLLRRVEVTKVGLL